MPGQVAYPKQLGKMYSETTEPKTLISGCGISRQRHSQAAGKLRIFVIDTVGSVVPTSVRGRDGDVTCDRLKLRVLIPTQWHNAIDFHAGVVFRLQVRYSLVPV